MIINHEFSRSVENARLQKKLTQKRVAELSDTSVRQYQNIINNGADTSLSTAVRIAAVLDISLDVLIQKIQPDETGVYRKPTNGKR